MAMGRPPKPYRPSWGGDPIPGLYKCPDGRWRINATGKRFTEPDERVAIARFKAWQRENQPAEECVDLPIATADIHTSQLSDAIARAVGGKRKLKITIPKGPGSAVTISRPVSKDEAWAFFR